MVLEANSIARPHLEAGTAHYRQGERRAARESFEAALVAQPDLSPAAFNLGVLCRESEENEAAEAYFRQVIARGEIVADAYNNLGILAMRRASTSEAIEYYRQAIERRYEFPLAHFNLSTALLAMGHWDEGWKEFEWRWQTPTFTPIRCPQPLWDGRPLDGTLLLHTEQGIGDVFQFARFIPEIRKRCRRVMFLRPDSLDCMFPTDQWADEVRSPGTFALSSFDSYLPLMSAPHVLGIGPEDLVPSDRYLAPVDRNVPLGEPHVPDAALRVGISWRGSPTYTNDAYRSVDVRQFMPLLQVPRVAFYSLQVGETGDELETLGDASAVVRDLRTEQSDFADTAAIVRQLDLVITVDTSVLHLCGGLGRPVWGLICRRSDWRWLGHDRQDNLWYQSLRLFRQRSLNDWAPVMAEAAEELRRLVDASLDGNGL